MRYKLFSIVLISLLSSSLRLSAQEENKDAVCSEAENKKARDFYEKGTDKKKYKKPERLDFLNKAIELEPDYAAAHLALAQEIVVKCKLDNLPFAPAIPHFMKAIQVCPQIHSEPYYFIGFHYYELVKNDSAIFWLDKFVKFLSDDETKFAKDYEAEMYQAKEMIKYAKKEAELKKKVVPFKPEIVKGISTRNSEYLPYISPDESHFLFTRAMPNQSMDRVYATDKEKEVFTIAKRKADGSYEEGTAMEFPFNQNAHEGGACLTIDNKHLYYTQTRSEGGVQPNTDIYYCDNIDDAWEAIKKMPNINDPVYWDSQPTVSADGNTLIFVSDRPGGYGKTDLYISTRDQQSKAWSAPVNMGPVINTSGTELCPFLHSDSETLYFSSDGHFGFGELDIFFTRKDEKGKWKAPENIGYPINGETKDAGLIVSTDGKYAYFCSWAEGKLNGMGVGKSDLYRFELYKEARPEAVTFLRGQLKNENGDPVKGASVELKNVKTKEKTLAVVDSVSGHYVAAVSLKKKDDIIVTAKAEGHAFASEVVKLNEDVSFARPPKPLEMKVERAETGKSFVIKDIHYATGAAELYPASFIVLDEFAEYLKAHPNMKIEIQGHTDNVGHAPANLALSDDRSHTVKEYLEKKGVNPHNITAKGFGSGKPIADNSTAEGRAANRRTEFLIIAQ